MSLQKTADDLVMRWYRVADRLLKCGDDRELLGYAIQELESEALTAVTEPLFIIKDPVQRHIGERNRFKRSVIKIERAAKTVFGNNWREGLTDQNSERDLVNKTIDEAIGFMRQSYPYSPHTR